MGTLLETADCLRMNRSFLSVCLLLVVFLANSEAWRDSDRLKMLIKICKADPREYCEGGCEGGDCDEKGMWQLLEDRLWTRLKKIQVQCLVNGSKKKVCKKLAAYLEKNPSDKPILNQIRQFTIALRRETPYTWKELQAECKQNPHWQICGKAILWVFRK